MLEPFTQLFLETRGFIMEPFDSDVQPIMELFTQLFFRNKGSLRNQLTVLWNPSKRDGVGWMGCMNVATPGSFIKTV